MYVRRPVIEQNAFKFDILHDFGYDNLIVSGCSFTYNNSDQHACTWPYYLKDLGNFKSVYDCSLPGAGNYHIKHSLQWLLTNKKFNPESCMIIVMWSGNDRNDFICDQSALNDYPFRFSYNDYAATAITGGMPDNGGSNIRISTTNINSIKSRESRSIENFLYRDGLKTWLDFNQYKSVFLEYMDRSLPHRSGLDFEINEYLPFTCQQRLKQITDNCSDLYSFALKNDLLFDDDFHPSADGHLRWTKEILVPFLKTLNI